MSVVPSFDERSAGPDDHGLGRDGPHHGPRPSGPVRPARAGSTPVAATVIDTPYGFQENADDISARIVDYFAGSIGRPMTVASYRSSDVDAVSAATALARIGEARYVLAGPGSPSYALRQWAGGPIRLALAAKLADWRDGDHGQRRGADGRHRDHPGLRDLQGRRRPGMARGPRSARAGDRPAEPRSSRTTTTPRAATTTPASATSASDACGSSSAHCRRASSSSASTATPVSFSTSTTGPPASSDSAASPSGWPGAAGSSPGERGPRSRR